MDPKHPKGPVDPMDPMDQMIPKDGDPLPEGSALQTEDGTVQTKDG
jgi:hypothetical protein